MILAALILILLIGAVLSWAAAWKSSTLSRWIAIVALAADLALMIGAVAGRVAAGAPGPWIVLDLAWMPRFGSRLHLAMDGLSFWLVALSFVLGIAAVAASWRGIQERVGFFHFNLLGVLAGVVGVFTAHDLLLFYIFWELMIVPMALLIAIWGHENRTYAAIKFFLFTQASGLCMLLSIFGLAFLHRQATGVLTFDYNDLLGTPLSVGAERWLMLGFFAAFAVKLPVVPVHTWLPDAHTEAPTAGSVILAGLLLKTGGYGLIRFLIPLFPRASEEIAPIALVLGAVGILYGAIVAFGQTDLKRLVAYTSVSHLGFVLLGVYSGTAIGLDGAVIQMIAHGLGTGALFILVGAIDERVHTRDLRAMGGWWATVPKMGGLALFFTMAGLGLPGLGSFIGEILVLIGAFQKDAVIAAVATAGLIVATLYSLRMLEGAFFGREAPEMPEVPEVPDPGAATHRPAIRELSLRERSVLWALGVLLLLLGLAPQPVIRSVEPAMRGQIRALSVAGGVEP